MNDNASRLKKKPCVALIGLRGCGKSTVGAELAGLRRGACLDTDAMVVQEAGRAIAEIFAAEGEAGFRKRESDAIRKAVAAAPAVISVGGGAILDEVNIRRLQRVATVVWLTAPAELLWKRISADRSTSSNRPALTDLSGLQEVQNLLAERSPHYRAAADLIVDTTDRSPAAVARDVAARLDQS